MMEDYKQLYNEHTEYQLLRERKGDQFNKYIQDVKFWKLKYLEELIFRNKINNDIKNVVEIGCATGELINLFLQNKQLSKVGIDISDKNIRAAKEFHPHIKFTFEDYLTYFKEKQHEIDVVILSDILEHVEDDIQMTQDSGQYSKYVLINLPIEKVPEYEGREYGINDVEGHLRAYSVKDGLKLVENAGLRVVDHIVKQYVLEPVFRNYLLKKLSSKHKNLSEANYAYLEEINEIEMNKYYYKKNLFLLATK